MKRGAIGRCPTSPRANERHSAPPSYERGVFILCYNSCMFSKITEKTFYQYLKCPNWVYFDAHTQDHKAHDALMQRLIADDLVDEKKAQLISDRVDIAHVTAEDPDRAYEETLTFMREGRQTIVNGVLVDKHWVGHPDLLERVEGQSRFGKYYYVAVDIKRSRFLRDDFKFQGCFYAELLERVQQVRPQQGYVMNADGEVMSYVIDEFAHHYKLTLSEIEKIIAGQRPVHFVTSGCKQSPWFEVCRSESEECDDLSLLNRVWREEVHRLEEAGVKTIQQLALLSVTELETMAPDMSSHRLEIMRDQAIAIKEGRHIIRQHVDMPEAKIELFFDIESDPLRDFDYLFGVLKVDAKGETFHPFFAEDPSQEEAMWRSFVDFVEQHLEAPIYHYGWFEVEVVHRYAAKYGISEIAREALDRNMIDILAVIRPAVIFPLSFYSLKDIAHYLGFHWRSEDASGANSVMWFEEWLADKSKKRLLQKIMDYNEDDVRATHFLQRWVRQHASL